MSQTTVPLIADHLTIRSVEQLHYLLTPQAIFQNYTRIKLQLKDLDERKTTYWENKINRYYKACGCREGKFFVLISLFAFLFTCCRQTGFDWGWKAAGIGFLYCLAGAFVGKIAGKVFAYAHFRKTVKKLAKQTAN